MNRFYKPFLIVSWLFLFGAFTSTSLGQTVTLSKSASTVGEDAGSVTLTATADPAPAGGVTVTVTITVTGGTASAGDFSLTSTTITIVGNGVNTIGITTLAGVADDLFEGNETVIIEITNVADNGGGGGGDQGPYSESGNQFQIVQINDAETISISRNNDPIDEDGGTVTYTATASGAVDNGLVTVTMDFTGGTATSGVDFAGAGNITITNGETVGIVLITSTPDEFLEGDETIVGEITALSYPGVTIVTPSASTTITDAERVTLTPAPTTPIEENAGTATLTATISDGGTLRLSTPGPLNVTIAYSGTAINATDYTGSTTIIIADSDPSGEITITAIQDGDIELDETITATLTGVSIGGANIIGATVEQTITITDDEIVLTSPANNAINQDLDVTLTWDVVVGADRYQLFVNTAVGFDDIIIVDGDALGNVQSNVPGGLSDNVTYYWKIIPTSSSTPDTRAASNTEVRSFTTTQQGNGTFPLDNAVGIVLFPTLTWPTGPTGTDTYRLEVNTEVGFGGDIIFDDATLTGTSQQIAGLSNATEYFWRVTASSNLRKVNTSTVNSFTTSTDKLVTLTFPKSGETVGTLVQTLFWTVTNTEAELTFEYQINTTGNFTEDDPTPIVGTTATSVTTATLTGGETYSWRVRSKTIGNFYSQWSTVGTFVTQEGLTAAPVPTISWPLGNPTLFDTTPTLYWYLSSVAPTGATLNFDIEVELTSVDFDDTPTYPAVGSSTLTNFAVTTPLVPGSSYHWQVRTNNTTPDPDVTSAYSSEGTFTISIGEGGAPLPVLSWPIGGVTVYTITPTLYWYLSTFATGVTYDIDVDDDANFSSTVFTTTGQGPQFVLIDPVTPLTAGTTYFWRVRTHNGGNTSDYVSTNGSFVISSTIASAPTPVLSWPIGGATVYSNKPLLSWYLAGPPPSGATIRYNVKVFDNIGMSSLVASITNTSLATQFWTVTSALDPGTHYWQVEVKNTTASTTSGFQPVGNGTAANSFVVSATASGVAVAPTPIYPTGNVTVSTLTPLLSWFVNGVLAGDETYSLELKPTSLAFDGAGLVTGITTQTHTTIVLTPGTAYRWRVQSVSATNGTSSFSAEALFTTAATLAPPPPVEGGPINGAIIANGQPDVSWYLPTAPKSALKYRLQISEDANMNTIAFEFDDIDAFHTVISSLKGGTTYYWRVQSKDNNGVYSAHSKVSRFVTGSVTAVDNGLVIPEKFSLEQNYPNPFNPTTTIRFALPEASFVILKIYNMLGQEVKTLVNGEKNAGTYSVQWRGDNDFGHKVSSGTYIYRVIAGQNIFVKKMILLK